MKWSVYDRIALNSRKIHKLMKKILKKDKDFVLISKLIMQKFSYALCDTLFHGKPIFYM